MIIYSFIYLFMFCIVIGFLIGSSYWICIDIKQNRKKMLFEHDYFFVYYFIEFFILFFSFSYLFALLLFIE